MDVKMMMMIKADERLTEDNIFAKHKKSIQLNKACSLKAGFELTRILCMG